jgi:hypothetical protein
MPFKLRDKYLANPVRIGPLIGVMYAGIVALCVAAVCLLLHFSDVLYSPSGESHNGLLIGFVIGPLTMLAGAPWSIAIFAVSQKNSYWPAIAVFGAALGLLINGSIIGLIVGMRARARIVRANRK